MQLTGADILIRTLIEQGCDTVFGYPGGQILNVYDSLYKYQNEIRHMLTAHEQGAAHAADGYARATGKVGVVMSTSGPGATNLVTGIATAYLDSIPLVADLRQRADDTDRHGQLPGDRHYGCDAAHYEAQLLCRLRG